MNTFCQKFGIHDKDADYESVIKTKNEYKSDLAILKIIAAAKEFEQLKVRPEEEEEIKKLYLDESMDINMVINRQATIRMLDGPTFDKELKVICLIQV